MLVRSKQKIEHIPDLYADRIVRRESNEIELVINRDTDSVMQVLDDLRAGGIAVDYVSVLNDSLEDVFVRMTGNEGGSI